MIRTGLLLCLWLPLPALAADLPEPLTLDAALSQAQNREQGDWLQALARTEGALADKQSVDADSAITANINLSASLLEPAPLSPDQSGQDYTGILTIQKKLYDFGLSDKAQTSAEIEHQAYEKYQDYVLQQRRLAIAKQYFDVILSDLRYAWDNEAMAVAYVQFNNAKDKHELQQMSDVDLLDLEDEYEKVRYRRYQAEMQQRQARMKLAEAMQRPGELSSQLKRPAIKPAQLQLPDYDTLVQQAMAHNGLIQRLQAQVQAADLRLEAARQSFRPRLDAEVKAGAYSRDLSSNDRWRAGISLTIPLLESESVMADSSRQRSRWLELRGMLEQSKSLVRQRVLELWQTVSLQQTRIKQLKTTLAAKELALDRNRALYEMEFKTDLGDAMVAISEVRYQQGQAEFRYLLAWMELELLTGQPVQPQPLVSEP